MYRKSAEELKELADEIDFALYAINNLEFREFKKVENNKCPTCHGNIEKFKNQGVIYCPLCGQAIEWPKEAENGKT